MKQNLPRPRWTLGSLGDEIGHEVARMLGYQFPDREIIARAAADEG